jgi:hypothetical protein
VILGETAADNPMAFMACDLVYSAVQLALTLPFETAKRRMQLTGAVKVY